MYTDALCSVHTAHVFKCTFMHVHTYVIMYIKVETRLGHLRPGHLGHLGHSFPGQVGLIQFIKYHTRA